MNEVVICKQVLGVTFTFKLKHLENVFPKCFYNCFFSIGFCLKVYIKLLQPYA